MPRPEVADWLRGLRRLRLSPLRGRALFGGKQWQVVTAAEVAVDGRFGVADVVVAAKTGLQILCRPHCQLRCQPMLWTFKGLGRWWDKLRVRFLLDTVLTESPLWPTTVEPELADH